MRADEIEEGEWFCCSPFGTWRCTRCEYCWQCWHHECQYLQTQTCSGEHACCSNRGIVCCGRPLKGGGSRYQSTMANLESGRCTPLPYPCSCCPALFPQTPDPRPHTSHTLLTFTSSKTGLTAAVMPVPIAGSDHESMRSLCMASLTTRCQMHIAISPSPQPRPTPFIQTQTQPSPPFPSMTRVTVTLTRDRLGSAHTFVISPPPKAPPPRASLPPSLQLHHHPLPTHTRCG